MWEVDWTHEDNTGTYVMARNAESRCRSAREWHLVATARLRDSGINTPVYRADSWEVDWNKRNGKRVWARNPHSKMPSAHGWHWIDYHTIQRAGLQWKPAQEHTGRYVDGSGYVTLTRMGMTDADISLAEEQGLFRGARKTFVKEHQLVAVKKYGALPPDSVVRHVNGIKTDNRPENLVLGTTQENTMDHNSARLMVMYWREKYETVQAELTALKARIADARGDAL